MHAHPPSLLLLFFFLLLPTCTHTFASPNKKPRPKKITIDLGNNISSTTPSANTVWSSIDGNLRKEKEKPPKKKSNKNAKKEMIALQRSSTSTSSPSSPSPTVKVASRGNKKVTIVAPLSKLPRSPKEIFKLLKGKLGTGGTIMGDAVEIQGDHKTKVEEILKLPRGGFTSVVPPKSATATFLTYLELTDAYGLLFNANYLRLYERTLGKRITRCKDMKFLAPARLGDLLSVSIVPTISAPETYKCTVQSKSQILNSATISTTPAPTEPTTKLSDNKKVYTTPLIPYEDELHRDNSLSSTDVLKWFERSRTDTVGGPVGIQKGINEGIGIVVAKASLEMSTATINPYDPPTLSVRSNVQMRKGRIATFRHELFISSSLYSHPLATADVTCIATDAETGKPSRFPDWMLT